VTASIFVASAAGSSLRRTPIVEAFDQARPSVVNIHGRKTVRGEHDEVTTPNGLRQVNGMGTGVVIDERGYIVTNFHVVEGVGRIQVTTADGETLVAHLIAHDPKTDLAVIKVDTQRRLPVITIGTSSDLMTGETVIAIGNAYGYEHTVTKGIISALHRPVQVSEQQRYDDLIQTDASINPGNSGGPLLNIDGEMVGLNVAVRVGAQGIGFAVPIDQALEIVANLIDVEVKQALAHGVRGKSVGGGPRSKFVVTSISSQSPADLGGLAPGDVITSVDGKRIQRSLDFQCAMLDHQPGEKLLVQILRDGEQRQVRLALDEPQGTLPRANDRTWDTLGLRLAPISDRSFRKLNSRYRGGLRVLAVRPQSPASSQGIRYGDILVGMLKWETVTLDNVAYILDSDEFRETPTVKFYILRGNETLFGHLQVSM
jgi:serine protease Do